MAAALRRRALLAASLLAAEGATGADAASTDGWRPSRPVHLVLPLATGGSLDALARQLGARMAPALGQPLVVEARPGAGGNLALFVARAAADGHTLLVGWDSLVINPALYRAVHYDPLRDFTPIAQTIAAPQVLVVRAADGPADLAALVAAARAARPPLSWASGGNGSIGHLTGELFRGVAGRPDFAHVPYRGAAPAAIDLLAGVVDALWISLPAVAGHVREGRLRALAVTAAERSGVLPGVPTAAEAGYPDLVVTSWQGLLAPAATPGAVVAPLNAQVNAALADPELRAWILAQGSEPVGGPPERLASLLRHDLPRWAEVVRRSGAKLD